ncbi:MAG: hypothetical protein VW683_00390 [Betaproteobacteria bacterium]
MSNLKDLYENSTDPDVVKARQQSEGNLAKSYFDGVPRGQNNTAADVYQDQFKTRTPGDKQVQLSQSDDATLGTWKEPALNHLVEVVANNKLNPLNESGERSHKYNPRDSSTHYLVANNGELGVVYSG